ncbi:exodeoxyribonuclease V subunit gamma [Chitinimonas arctica]|uniref:RecBCD enzyme subunit RecC n=1 Tax=Chitinimonas arctica TaxID=2594795 RepID=A0A516SEP3_9NEIS|nr:exodeoxyribonuclease V subunit gamma [Chitinimonas arctica]QDQ26634.1 exodeoxyribonuclease V subunit gamma [Chitinimonas arctica]
MTATDGGTHRAIKGRMLTRRAREWRIERLPLHLPTFDRFLPAVLHLYQSNRLDTLATLLNEGILVQTPADPYTREQVIVQARGMGRWLGLRIAARFGICANIDFPLPATFLWQLIETVLGPQARLGPFGADALAWRLHGLLEQPPAALAAYLQDGSERRRWRLASRIADTFDQYLVYRPDWLESWEAGQSCRLGGDEAWQMALWRMLAAERDSAHRADLMHRLIVRLQDPAPLPLPERIVLFGIASLPPLLMEVLQALAKRIDVALFALNPCAAPWGDLDRRIDSRAPGERLLAAWGGQGRAFFDELAGVDDLHSLFDETPPPANLLAELQYDVLSLTSAGTRVLLPDDDSLVIHACHGPMRQVETLKDALLARFAADPGLQPDEVVVLCPNMDDFAPYVDAVFGQSEPTAGGGRAGAASPHLPYAIADKSGLAASPLLAGFLALLRLPDGNWEADSLMALLELPALAAGFGLLEEDLPQLQEWITQAGIRRGQAGDAFSWQAGIGRLLLGVTMPTGEQAGNTGLPLFADLHPSADLDLRFAARVAGLSRFSRTLAEWQNALARPRPLPNWAVDLAGWLQRWFVESEADRVTLETLRQCLIKLGEVGERSGMLQAVGRAAILEWLSAALEAGSGAGGFLTGGVTFAQLMPMRNLPFRVVAVLGLDDGAYPRESQPDGFDLIARHPRRGDRARALDERWLFLETVLAAREQLLLFYTGRDARNDAELPPSTVIADLLDAVDCGWHCLDSQAASRQILRRHSLQPFSAERFRPGSSGLASFDGRWAAIARLAGRGDALPAPLAAARLPGEAPREIELADLLAFVRNPAGWFLRRLGIRFDRGSFELAKREMFTVAGAEERELLQLAGALADQPHALAALGQGAARLPDGPGGQAWAARQAVRFAPAVSAWRGLSTADLAVSLRVDGLQLSGVLRGVDAAGLGLRQAGKLRESDRLAAWLQTLVLGAAKPANMAHDCRLIGLDEIAHYRAPERPAELLADWLALYRAAHASPPPLLPRCGLAYADGLSKGRNPGPDKAAQAALAAWQGNDRQTGEGDFDQVRALWRGQAPLGEDFVALCEQLLQPMLAHERIGNIKA